MNFFDWCLSFLGFDVLHDIIQNEDKQIDNPVENNQTDDPVNDNQADIQENGTMEPNQLVNDFLDTYMIKANHRNRPKTFDDFVGNKEIVERLKLSIMAAQRKNTVLPHILFYGSQGTGKTTLANIVSNEIKYNFKVITGSTIETQKDIYILLYEIGQEQIKGINTLLFIDECHDIAGRDAPETLWFPLLEDFAFFSNLNGYIKYGDGEIYAKPAVFVQPFTVIGATTDPGMLSAPLRDRFQIQCSLHEYSPEELSLIIKKFALRTKVDYSEDSLSEIAARARGNPRIAINLFQSCFDRAIVNSNEKITRTIVLDEMNSQHIDDEGLTENDYKVLKVLTENPKGMGIKNLAGTVGINQVTLSEMILPFLQFRGYTVTTSRRFITPLGKEKFDRRNVL